MIKTNKAVEYTMMGAAGFALGALLSHCTMKPKTEYIEIEKPVEIIKEVEVPVEKIVVKEKIVYRDIIPETLAKDTYTDDEMTVEKATEILENSDLFAYYVLNKEGKTRLIKVFHKGEKFYKFEAVGLFPIIYSTKEIK